MKAIDMFMLTPKKLHNTMVLTEIYRINLPYLADAVFETCNTQNCSLSLKDAL